MREADMKCKVAARLLLVHSRTDTIAFHGQAGSYTARQEAVQRGERYWYAYLRTGHKLRKKYLGKTALR